MELDSLRFMTTMMEDSMTSQTRLLTYDKYDMTKLKIATKRSNLGIRGNHLNLVEDEGLRRRPSGMEVTKHQG